MQTKEWTRIGYQPQLDLRLLHAYYVEHAYPRHSHDYYVISLIERGRQSFTHQGTKHLTAPGGVILINPDAVHTGEAVDDQGFQMRSLYPTPSHMATAALELTGHHQALPFFKEVRIDDPWAMNSLFSVHKAISEEADPLECESRLLWFLARLIERYGNIPSGTARLRKEKAAIRQARSYLEEHFSQGVSLKELAEHVALSPYYLLRLFLTEVGFPPHAYLESIRIREAQRLIEGGRPLAEVAAQVGFSNQSHLTHRFKQIIGATPGQYAQQMRT